MATSLARRHFQFCADMDGNLGGVVINEVPDAMMRDAPELGPFPQRPDRRLFACREYPAQAKAGDVGKLVFDQGRRRGVHACNCTSTQTATKEQKLIALEHAELHGMEQAKR